MNSRGRGRSVLIAVASFAVIGSLGVLGWSVLKTYALGVNASDGRIPGSADLAVWWWMIGSFITLVASSVALAVLVSSRGKRSGSRTGTE